MRFLHRQYWHISWIRVLSNHHLVLTFSIHQAGDQVSTQTVLAAVRPQKIPLPTELITQGLVLDAGVGHVNSDPGGRGRGLGRGLLKRKKVYLVYICWRDFNTHTHTHTLNVVMFVLFFFCFNKKNRTNQTDFSLLWTGNGFEIYRS